MHQDDEIILLVTGDVGDDGFARFEGVVAPRAKGALFKNRPAVPWHQLVRLFEGNQIQVVFGRLQKDKVFASVVV